MRLLSFCIALIGLASTSVLAESITPDPNDWFEEQYAPLWKAESWNSVDEIAKFYREVIAIHPPTDNIPVVNSRLWLSQGIEGWRSDGWVSSILAGYQSDQLNPSTALFKSKWLDVYADGSEEFSCSWYMADLSGGRWTFTDYAEIECADHDL